MLTDTVLMIRPIQFNYNAETAATNAFQKQLEKDDIGKVAQKAMAEFDAFAEKLKAVGINVLVFDDTPEPIKTDSVFPNNWITTHLNTRNTPNDPGGTIALYPMCHESRRAERRQDIVEALQSQFKFDKVEDFSYFEIANQFLEGTGSLILDRTNKFMYACLSPRTDKEVVETVAAKLNYKPVVFDSVDKNGKAIYHTNVMMSMGDTFVVICLESIKNEQEKNNLLNHFADTGKEIIDIGYAQMEQMAGNMIQLKNTVGENIQVMSEQAFHSLTDTQMTQLLMHNQIVYSDLTVIEKYGGGSARCMIAEIFYSS